MAPPTNPQQASAGAQGKSRSKSSPTGPKAVYLILYNAISAMLWSVVLGRTVLIATVHGYGSVFTGAGGFTKWTQTLAGLEVLHAAIGLVRAPLLTTLMQVASRFLLVWGIVHNFPNTTGRNPAYSTMLIAWSVTEVIRYSYFAVNLTYGRVSGWMTWLRYNTFFVLYPMGISSECWLVYQAIEPAKRWNAALEWVLKLILFVYVPGSYILFTHMMTQRKKVMRGDAKKAT